MNEEQRFFSTPVLRFCGDYCKPMHLLQMFIYGEVCIVQKITLQTFHPPYINLHLIVGIFPTPPALAAIEACRKWLGDDTPMAAAFDTAFHRSLPEAAATYALPHTLAERLDVRRYGFHGIAHASMVRLYAEAQGLWGAATGDPDVNWEGLVDVTSRSENGTCSPRAATNPRTIRSSSP